MAGAAAGVVRAEDHAEAARCTGEVLRAALEQEEITFLHIKVARSRDGERDRFGGDDSTPSGLAAYVRDFPA